MNDPFVQSRKKAIDSTEEKWSLKITYNVLDETKKKKKKEGGYKYPYIFQVY